MGQGRKLAPWQSAGRARVMIFVGSTVARRSAELRHLRAARRRVT